MAGLRLAFALLASLLLPGCMLFGGESSASPQGPDKTDYEGGAGFALAIAHHGADPFDVTLRVLGAGNAELARIDERIEPGARIEKWWSIEEPSTYSARLDYVWNGGSGSTSHGLDEQTFDARGCPTVTRLTWELRQDGQTVGSAFLGKECVDDAP